MRYLSLFSGIETVSLAWRELSWQPVAFSEVEPFCCELLAQHFPAIPNLGDVTAITTDTLKRLGPVDIVVGGSPCQDFSIAGKRAGIAGSRSSLFYHFVEVFHAARTTAGARYLVWENVQGVLTVNHGRDFAAILNLLVGCSFAVPEQGWQNSGVAAGPGGMLEWRVFNAKHFGVPQSRRRIYLVLDTGDWRSRVPILLEPQSSTGDVEADRAEKQTNPKKTAVRTAKSSTRLIHCDEVAHCLLAHSSLRLQPEMESYIAFDCHDAPSHPLSAKPIAPALRSGGGSSKKANGGSRVAVTNGVTVRRLTPIECERLQGIPDNWTYIQYKGKPALPAPRYRSVGNAMAVPVMRWIGQRIKASDQT